jgi:hypothetical protein
MAPKGRAEDRRARAEALRRQRAAEERRRKVLVYGGFSLVVLGLAGGIAFAVSRTGDGEKAGEVLPRPVAGPTTVQKPVSTVPDRSGIPGVVAYDTTGHPTPGTPRAGSMEFQHVPGPVVYSVTPPVGGPHNPTWMNCGVYTAAVPNERAVHDLEHGAIWITYRPALAASDVTALRDIVLGQPKVQGNRYMDLSPWASASLPTPIVLSAWGRQLRLRSASDPRIKQFIDAFRLKQGITPEYGSPCDGVPVDVGGRPAAG